MKIYILLLISMFVLLAPCITFSQPANCDPNHTDTYWKISETLYGSRKLSNCHPDAYYNCHGFVRSYFENGCTAPGWAKTPVAAPYECPEQQGFIEATFKNSGKYVQVCSETNANIAYYQFIQGDHSAVKEISGNGTIKYLSKYSSNGPLVAHNLTGSWYHIPDQNLVPPKPIQFWSYIGSITGNSNISGISPKTFSVTNIAGVTYSWSIISGYSNIYISSASNQNTVTLTSTHSGTAVLQLSISSACGSVNTQQITLNIQTNVCLEGTFTNAGGGSQNLYTTNSILVGSVNATVTCPNATSFTWQKTSGTINSFFTSGANVSFSMTSGGSISFLVTAKNGSTTLATRNIAFYNYGSFRVAPNPASNSLTIDLNEEIPFKVVLQNFDLQIKKEINNYRGKSIIDISALRQGEYALSIYHEGKLINQQIVMIAK